jgi:hypothetical protein
MKTLRIEIPGSLNPDKKEGGNLELQILELAGESEI